MERIYYWWYIVSAQWTKNGFLESHGSSNETWSPSLSSVGVSVSALFCNFPAKICLEVWTTTITKFERHEFLSLRVFFLLFLFDQDSCRIVPKSNSTKKLNCTTFGPKFSQRSANDDLQADFEAPKGVELRPPVVVVLLRRRARLAAARGLPEWVSISRVFDSVA